MELIKDPNLMQSRSCGIKSTGKRISFVPTMGALHEGHLSLFDIAAEHGDIVVISIFLNPKQFGPTEDLKNYPKMLERDLELAKMRGVDICFCPNESDIYPEGFETHVEVERITRHLCGLSRPHLFRGVTTVVCKLLNIVMPDSAIFGEKDYQQLKVIQRMVKDLNMGIKIISGPIIREEDGLAMSSRNAYLSPTERRAARSIPSAIFEAQEMVKNGERNIDKLKALVRRRIEETGVGKVDYVSISDPDTLEDLHELKAPSLLAVAAFFGKARLIDNCLLLT